MLQLAGVNYTKNRKWYNVKQGSQADNDMRRALHRGSMKVRSVIMLPCPPLAIALDDTVIVIPNTRRLRTATSFKECQRTKGTFLVSIIHHHMMYEPGLAL